MNTHLYRLYFNFVPVFIKDLADDYYQSSNKKDTLLARITFQPLKRTQKDLYHHPNLTFHHVENFRDNIFPRTHYLLNSIESEEQRKRHQNIVLTEVSQLLHKNWRNKSLHRVLPYKDEELSRYKSRTRDKVMLPYTAQLLRALNQAEQEKELSLKHLAQSEITDQNLITELKNLGLSDQEIEEQIAKRETELPGADAREIYELINGLPYSEMAYFDQAGHAFMLAFTPLTDGTIALDAILDNRVVLTTALTAEQFEKIPQIFETRNNLINDLNSRGLTLTDQPLTYDPNSDSFIGAAANEQGETFEFVIPAAEINKIAQDFDQNISQNQNQPTETIAAPQILNQPSSDEQTLPNEEYLAKDARVRSAEKEQPQNTYDLLNQSVDINSQENVINQAAPNQPTPEKTITSRLNILTTIQPQPPAQTHEPEAAPFYHAAPIKSRVYSGSAADQKSKLHIEKQLRGQKINQTQASLNAQAQRDSRQSNQTAQPDLPTRPQKDSAKTTKALKAGNQTASFLKKMGWGIAAGSTIVPIGASISFTTLFT